MPALLRRPAPRSGRFLAVASAAAARGLPMLAAYCAAKAGVTGLVRALAVELGGHRRHRQRGQPGLDRHAGARRERPAVRPVRRRRASPRSSRSAGCSSRPRWPGRWSGWPGRAAARSPGRCCRSTAGSRCDVRAGARRCPAGRAGGARPGRPAAGRRPGAARRRPGAAGPAEPARGGRAGRAGRRRERPPAVRRLARTLLDGGPGPPAPRPGAGRRRHGRRPGPRPGGGAATGCLAALGPAAPVLVVDDGSRDPAAVAAVAARHGARLLRAAGQRRARRGAQRRARRHVDARSSRSSTATAAAGRAGWAPCRPLRRPGGRRGRPAGRAAPAARRAARRGTPRPAARSTSGPREARVRPGGRVPYVPTAALVVRRAALPAARVRPGPALRRGRRPRVAAARRGLAGALRPARPWCRHAEPDRWRPWLVRRLPLRHVGGAAAGRHGARLAPLVVPPWPTAAGCCCWPAGRCRRCWPRPSRRSGCTARCAAPGCRRPDLRPGRRGRPPPAACCRPRRGSAARAPS